MRFFIWFIALLLGSHVAVWAQQKGAPGKDVVKNPAMDMSQPPSPDMFKPLPELKGVVSWKTLGQVTPVKQKDRFVPQFAKDIEALDKKEVKLQGFMMPLDTGEKQKRFLLTSMPPSCAFCMPGGRPTLEVQERSRSSTLRSTSVPAISSCSSTTRLVFYYPDDAVAAPISFYPSRYTALCDPAPNPGLIWPRCAVAQQAAVSHALWHAHDILQGTSTT